MGVIHHKTVLLQGFFIKLSRRGEIFHFMGRETQSFITSFDRAFQGLSTLQISIKKNL